MADCIICFESPCACIPKSTRQSASTRAPRRSSSQASESRRKVTRFSSAVKAQSSPSGPLPSSEPTQNEQSESSPISADPAGDMERSTEELIRILAPLLADRDLKPFEEYLPPDCKLTLDERRRKFRDEIRWSEGRYDD